MSLELQDILEKFGPDNRKNHPLPLNQLKAMKAMVDEAINLLQAFRAEAKESVARLCTRLEATRWRAQAAIIKGLAGRYEYDAAAEKIHDLEREIKECSE